MQNYKTAEKVRRREVEKFDFYGSLPFLRRLQEHKECSPKARNIVLHLINVVNKMDKYSTEALETCKVQIIMLKDKFGGINQSKRPDKSYEKVVSKMPITKSRKTNFDDGPSEISNSPVVLPKKHHVYIRNLKKPNQQEKIKSTNNDFVCSTPFEIQQDKWLFNKNETISIGGELDIKIKKTIENELRTSDQSNDFTDLADQQEFDRNKNLSDPRQSNYNTSLTEHGSTEPLDLQARKQNYLDRLKTAKIVTKTVTKNDSIDKTDKPRDPRLVPKKKTMTTNQFHKQNLQKDTQPLGKIKNALPESILSTAQQKKDEQTIKKKPVTGILNLLHDSTDSSYKAQSSIKEKKLQTKKGQNVSTEGSSKRYDNTGKDDNIRSQKVQIEASSVGTEGSFTKYDNTGKEDNIRAQIVEKKVSSKKGQIEASSVATESSSTKHDDTENANTITAQNEGLSIKNQSSSVSEKNINSMVNPINQPSQSEQIHEESENDDNLNDGFEVTLEVAKDQRHRNERKRKAPIRQKTGRRQSKRLKGAHALNHHHAIIKTESNEIPEVATLPEVIPTLPEVIPTIQEIHEDTNVVEIDSIKKEVIESDIPILNIPVTEPDLSEENEGMLLSCTKDDILSNEMIVKSENLYEPSEIKLESELEIKSENSLSQENSIEPNTNNMLIKEEPIEVSKAEIEAARLNVENLCFINHYLCFQFRCNSCQFETIDRPIFEEHLIMHNDLQWSGFCSACDAHVIGHDTSLQNEYNHMLKIHVKQTDFIDLNDETDKVPTLPLLKLRFLEGDYLSKKNT